ncbi:MAG: type II toxin-antitoxin system HicB family antitoxin [Bryobacteraceae bacterium]|jgi:predicted RNase H-like HicB family nuclease
MRLKVTIYGDEDGVFIAECPSIPGCVSQGSMEAETEANVMDAIGECLAVRAEMGLPPTTVRSRSASRWIGVTRPSRTKRASWATRC